MTNGFRDEIETDVGLRDDALRVCVDDRRGDVVAQFEALTEAQRAQLARDAWRIGLGAVSSAYARAQEAKLADVTRTLVSDLDGQLRAHLERQQAGMKETLAEYFDPRSGRVPERLEKLLADGGELGKLLERYVGADRSVLADTLARRVGQESPLFKLLSPTESEGLVQVLRAKVEEALAASRDEVAAALDPLADGSPVQRFLRELHERIANADEGRQAKLDAALAALNEADETSAMARLLRHTRDGHDALRRALDPQGDGSPMASFRRTLEELLDGRLRRQEERLAEVQRAQTDFHTEVQAAVARIETKRKEDARSTHGGLDFEDEVLRFASRVVPAGVCTVEATGSTVGYRPNCKVGDVVVRFGEESAFAGSGVVIEAKRDRSYQVPRALEELETAMANRGCGVGLFVMARTSAPEGFPGFVRFGSRLLVTWDPEDARTDGVLHGALVAALALAQRKQRRGDEGDLTALADVEQRVLKELERLDTMDGLAERIGTNAGKIQKELGVARKKLGVLVDKATATLRALNVELADEAAEAASPIEVGPLPARDADGDGAPDARDADAAE